METSFSVWRFLCSVPDLVPPSSPSGQRGSFEMARGATAESLIAAGLPVRKRLLLFCVASGSDWGRAGIPGEIVTATVVKGLIARDAGGVLALTDHGRAVLRAMLPDL
jgi:hypothetical protein